MKKIIKEEPIFEYVKKGTKSVETFIAEDGKEFKGYCAKFACENYEKIKQKERLWEGIEKLDEPLPAVWDWYHPKTDEELLVVLYHMGMDNGYDDVRVDDAKIKSGDLKNYVKVGDWIGYNYEDHGDHRGSRNIYTVEYIKQSIKFLDKLK